MNREKIESYSHIALGVIACAIILLVGIKYILPIIAPFLIAWFIAELTDAVVMENTPSLTYAQYHAEVKPKPQAPKTEKKQYVCSICGYVYEGDDVPDDYLCPLCKHGKEYFEEK